MISPDKKREVLCRLRAIEDHPVTKGTRTIGACCRAAAAESLSLASSTDALTPILRTALVINWPEAAMQKRYERFRREFPQISTLADMKKVIESTGAAEFCRTYLAINANEAAPHENPKYRLLKTLIDGFLEYQEEFNCETEIEALRHWGEQIDLCHIKQDFIGRRFGVGAGVIGNIRLNLGCRVVKPDRHVIGVMEQYLEVRLRHDQYSAFARFLGMDPRYLDCLLFEYGKAQGISS